MSAQTADSAWPSQCELLHVNPDSGPESSQDGGRAEKKLEAELILSDTISRAIKLHSNHTGHRNKRYFNENLMYSFLGECDSPFGMHVMREIY